MSPSVAKQIGYYIKLTKPSIVLLVVITGLCAMAAEGSLFRAPMEMILVLIALTLSAGSANAFNQFLERDIDAVMNRTRVKRPLPLGLISPRSAFIFALLIGVLGNAYLFYVNVLAAIISVLTILYYVLFYTAWLKPRHYYNIVIGGAAGSTAPLIAWAAGSGELSLYAWILFALIFTWTPPHFWALALALKKDYEAVQMPMLPNVLGEGRAHLEILIYTILLLPLSLLPSMFGYASFAYAGVATLLWVFYMKDTFIMMKKKTEPSAMRLFFTSILYLFFLFFAVGVDGAFRYYLG